MFKWISGLKKGIQVWHGRRFFIKWLKHQDEETQEHAIAVLKELRNYDRISKGDLDILLETYGFKLG